MWLAQDTAHKLCHGIHGGTGSQRTQDVGEGAIPTLLQRLFGNDHADPVVWRKKVLVLGLVQIILFRRFDRHVGFVQSGVRQPIPHVL